MTANGDTIGIREYQMALLQSIDEEKVVLAEACCKATTTLSREAFEKRFAGEAIILSTSEGADLSKTQKDADGADSKNASGNMGMAWFVPPVAWFKAVLRGIR